LGEYIVTVFRASEAVELAYISDVQTRDCNQFTTRVAAQH